jgi:hypothetical protein
MENSWDSRVSGSGDKKIKGPDNPTRQLLPIITTKCCSGDGDGEGKTKEVVEDREVKQSCV